MIADDLQHLTRPISDLTVWDKNYRQGDVGAVSLSLERFGQCKPIVGRHYGDELRIIAGNHTLLAASALGWDDLAVVVRDDLTEEEALAYAIADNRTSDLATNDLDVLAEHLTSIVHDEQLLLATGYDGDDIDRLSALGEVYPDAANDPWAESIGLPDYEANDETARYRIMVHVNTDDDLAALAKATGLSLTAEPGVYSVWFPHKNRERPGDYEWSET